MSSTIARDSTQLPPPSPGHDHPGFYFSSGFSYFDKYKAFPVWPRTIVLTDNVLWFFIMPRTTNMAIGFWMYRETKILKNPGNKSELV